MTEEFPGSKQATGGAIEQISQSTAEKKLTLLEEEDFKDYAVRFADVGELEEILTKRIVLPYEAFVPALSRFGDNTNDIFHNAFAIKEPLSFQDYLKNQGNNKTWRRTAWSQTQWQLSTGALGIHSHLIEMLKDARVDAREAGVAPSERRNEVLSKFREEILERSKKISQSITQSEGMFTDFIYRVRKLKERLSGLGVQNDADSLAQYILQPSENPAVKEITADFLQHVRFEGDSIELAEKVKVASEFVDNPDYIEEVGNLRKVFTLLIDSVGMGMEQYRVALIFSNDLVSSKATWSNNEWRILKKTNDGAGLLGVIAVVPEKTYAHKIVDLVRISEDFSCPVYSADGRLLYPEKTKS